MKKAILETKKNNAYSSLAEYLNHYLLLDDGIILHKDGESLSISFSVSAPDVETQEDVNLDIITQIIKDSFSVFSHHFIIEANLISTKAKGYQKGNVNRDKVTTLLDEARYIQYTNGSIDFYNSELFYTVTYSNPANMKTGFFGWLKKLFINQDDEVIVGQDDRTFELLKDFKKTVELFKALLRRADLNLKVLTGKQLYSFIYFCVNEKQPILDEVDEDIMASQLFLSNVFSQSNVVTGSNLMVGDKYIKCITLDNNLPLGYYPTLLQALYTLDVEFRFSVRYKFIEKNKIIKTFEERRERARRRKHGLAQGFEEIGGFKNEKLDTVSEEQADELIEIIHEARTTGRFGYLNMTIVISDENQENLALKIERIKEVVSNEKFFPMIEKADPTDVWLGTIPSHCKANLRGNTLNTEYFANILPKFGIWQGIPYNTYLLFKNSPAFAEILTAGNKKFFFNLIDKDVGHTLLAGETGGGKTTLLGLILIYWFARHKGVRAVISDYYHGLYGLVKALGGAYIDVFKNAQFAPFQRANDLEYQKDFLLPWLNRIIVLKVEEEKAKSSAVFITDKKQENVEKIIFKAVERLVKANKEVGEKLNFRNFIAQIDNVDVQEIFENFLNTLPTGLFDGENDDKYWKNDLIAFNKTNILQNKAASFYEPILGYLYDRLYSDNRPTLGVIDECRVDFNSEYLRKKLNQDVTTDRHKNKTNIYCLQAVSDSNQKSLHGDSDIVFDINLKNRIFLPSKKIATEEKIRNAYRDLGCNERELDLLGSDLGYGYYYIKQSWAGGNRFIYWEATELEKAFVGLSSKNLEQLEMLDKIYNPANENWVNEWLKYMGVIGY